VARYYNRFFPAITAGKRDQGERLPSDVPETAMSECHSGSCGAAMLGANTEEELKIEKLTMLTRLLEQDRKKFLRAAQRFTRNQDEAEDVIQDSVLKALIKLQSFRGESRLDTWLYTIICNCAISRLRSPARRRSVSLDTETCTEQDFPRWVALDLSLNPEDSSINSELLGIMRAEIEALGAPYRSVLQLCDLEGFPSPEAADVLQLNQHTLEARLYRGRRRLRDRVLRRVMGEEHCLQLPQMRVHTGKARRRKRS